MRRGPRKLLVPNGIGTSLASGSAVQGCSRPSTTRRSSQHPWTCSGATVRDPRSRRAIAVVNVAGAADTGPPVDSRSGGQCGQAGGIRTAGEASNRIGSAPDDLGIDAGSRESADKWSWTAVAGSRTVDSMAPIYRIALPKVMSSGEHWLPSLGLCMCEPLPGGWLIRPQMDPASGTVCAEVELDVQDPNAMELRYSSAMGSWSIDLSPRHSQILVALTHAPEGLTASQLASQLFGDPRKTVTVRAEMSRLRKRLAGILLAQPYRFDPAVRVKTAPAVRLY